MGNPDLTIFLEKVNRGKDLRWVGSRCPLTRALIVTSLLYAGSSNKRVNYEKGGIRAKLRGGEINENCKKNAQI